MRVISLVTVLAATAIVGCAATESASSSKENSMPPAPVLAPAEPENVEETEEPVETAVAEGDDS